jgi:hypothetical protein
MKYLGPIHTMRHVSVPSPFHLRSVRMVSVHTVRRVQPLSRTARDRRPVIISIKYAAHCHGTNFPLFVNYYNFGDNRMIVTSKCAIKKHFNLPDFFNSSPICPHTFPFHTLSLYFLFHMSNNSSHLRTNSVNISSISEDKNREHSLQANTRSAVEET